MAEITSGSLIQDWYERYVRPLKQPISLTSKAPQDFNIGLPPRNEPAISTPAPAAPVVPPPSVSDSMVPAPYTQEQAAPAAGPSWSESLNKGLQDPAKLGLLSMGLSMMAAPPRAVPYSAGEIVGGAGLVGINHFEKALEAKRRQQIIDQTAEEHRLTREELRTYRQGQLEVARQNAESSTVLKEAAAADRRAQAKNEEALSKVIDPRTAEYYGVRPDMTVREFQAQQSGLIASKKPRTAAWKQVEFNGKAQWMDLNDPNNAELVKAGALQPYNKPGFTYRVDDQGNVTEIEKGTGEKTSLGKIGKSKAGVGGTGGRGGGAGGKQYTWEWEKSREALIAGDPEKGIPPVPNPTNEEISKKRFDLFPAKKPGKAAGRNPRTEMGAKPGEKRVQMKDGTVAVYGPDGKLLRVEPKK